MLSENAKDKILEWKEKNIKAVYPVNWHKLFFKIAAETAERSKDSNTHCGAVIVRNNTILSTGYNSFIRDINDEILPNSGNEKYPFFIHAELNAIINCAREGISTLGASIYITGKCCNNCLQQIYQAGIKDIYEGPQIAKMCEDETYKLHREILLHLIDNKLKIHSDVIS